MTFQTASYTVQSGDTLGGIAQRTASTVDTLTTANCLTNPDALEVGQVLWVPVQLAQPALGILPRVGEVAGMPSMNTCWASNAGRGSTVYTTVDGDPMATLVNRAVVSDAYGTGWVKIDFVGGADIRDGQGWMRVADISLIGDCSNVNGVSFDTFQAALGNPSGVPSGICAVVVSDPSTRLAVYRSPTDTTERIAWMIGWARWISTQGNYYEVEFDDARRMWVSAAETTRLGC